MNAQRLSWWRRRLEGTVAEAPLAFIPAEVVGAVGAAGGAGTRTLIRLPGDVVVETTDVSALPVAWVARPRGWARLDLGRDMV